MSSDNLNSVDDKTDPLSSAAKHMDERLRGANQSALLSAQTGVKPNDSGTPAMQSQPVSAGNPAVSIPPHLKAFLTLLAIPVGISLFTGLCRTRQRS